MKALVGEMMVQGENNMVLEKHSGAFLNMLPEQCDYCNSRIGFLYGNDILPVCMNCSMERQSS